MTTDTPTDLALRPASEKTAIEALASAELDAQITTAKAYPRDVAVAVSNAIAIATMDPETAESCWYSIPRGGKTIEGPSIRCAEIVASSWGNLRVASRLVEIGEKTVTCQGVAHDLQSNLASSVEVSRRITDSRGRRFSDDMIQVTIAAASAIARRNAIFGVCPKSVVKTVEKAARRHVTETSGLRAKAHQVVERISEAFAVDADDQLAVLGVESIDDMGWDHVQTLIGLGTAIREGGTTVQQAFGGKAAPEKGPATADDVLDAIMEEQRQTAAKEDGDDDYTDVVF